jgi:hypothetical protein
MAATVAVAEASADPAAVNAVSKTAGAATGAEHAAGCSLREGTMYTHTEGRNVKYSQAASSQ